MKCDRCGVTAKYDVHQDRSDPRWHPFVYLRRDGSFYRREYGCVLEDS